MNYYFKQMPRMVISLAALGCTIIVGAASIHIMEIYRTSQPIWVEQAAYGQWPMVKFLQRLSYEGFWPALLQSLGGRHLLQISILGMVMPSLLRWFHAPLVIALPTFAVFLGLFGWTVYRRTQHTGYAVSAMLLYCASADLTRHNWGIGSGFADWQSMFLLNAAVLCLLNALMEPGLPWIRAFAIFLCLGILARTTAVFHAVAMCGPILLLYLIVHYKRSYSLQSVGAILLNLLIIVSPAALIIFKQLPSMLAYYSPAQAWSLRQPLITSVSNIFLTLLVPFMGISLVMFCAILFVWHMLQLVLSGQRLWLKNDMKHSFLGWTELAMTWWGFGFLGYLLLNGYTSDVPKEVMYAVPALLFSAVTPFRQSQPPVKLKRLALIITLFSILSFGGYTFLNTKRALTLTLEQVNLRQTQLELAAKLAKMPDGISWQSYTPTDWSIPVSLLTLYEYGKFRGSPEYFYNRKEYWGGAYPGLSLHEVQQKLYEKTVACIDVAIILQDPAQHPPQMEDYSYSIAASIARNVQSDSRWLFKGKINARPSNTQFSIYSNTMTSHSSECQK